MQRVVGFQPGHHKKLTTFKEKMESMAITDCKVRSGRQSKDLEIIIKPASKIEASPKKLTFDKTQLTNCQFTLSKLDNEIDYECVSLDGKVIRVQDPINVANGLKKKDITIANATYAAKLRGHKQSNGR